MPIRTPVKRSRTPLKLKRKHLNELRNRCYVFSLEFEALYDKYTSSLSSSHAEDFRKIGGIGFVRLADLNSKIIRLAEKGDVLTLETQEEFSALDRLLWKLSALTKELVTQIETQILDAKEQNITVPGFEHLSYSAPASRVKSSGPMPDEENRRETSAGAAQSLLGPSVSCSSSPIGQRINSLRTSELHDAKTKRPLPNPSVSTSPQLHTPTRNEKTQAYTLKAKRHTNPQAYQTRPQKLDAQI